VKDILSKDKKTPDYDPRPRVLCVYEACTWCHTGPVVCNGAVGLAQDGYCLSTKRFHLSKAEYSFSPTQKHYVGNRGIFMYFLVKLTHTKI